MADHPPLTLSTGTPLQGLFHTTCLPYPCGVGMGRIAVAHVVNQQRQSSAPEVVFPNTFNWAPLGGCLPGARLARAQCMPGVLLLYE